jgi:hypothetical protein
MSLILNGTTGLFGNVTGGDISGNFTGGNSSATTAIATGSSTARSLANRFGDVVNVKDFGADPSASASANTIAIQAALDYAAQIVQTIITNKVDIVKAKVIIPSGIYQTNATLLVGEGVTLEGASQSTSIIKPTHTGVAIQMGGSSREYSQVIIRNLGILGNRSGTLAYGSWDTTTTIGIYAENCIRECSIQNCFITQCRTSIKTENSYAFEINQNYLTFALNYHIEADNLVGGRISGNRIDWSEQHGIYLNGANAGDATISLVIESNAIQICWKNGLWLYDVSSVTVQNNFFEANYRLASAATYTYADINIESGLNNRGSVFNIIGNYFTHGSSPDFNVYTAIRCNRATYLNATGNVCRDSYYYRFIDATNSNVEKIIVLGNSINQSITKIFRASTNTGIFDDSNATCYIPNSKFGLRENNGGIELKLTSPTGQESSIVLGDIFDEAQAGFYYDPATKRLTFNGFDNSERLQLKQGGQLKFATLTSNPTSDVSAGDVYYNTTTNTLRLYNGTSWFNLTMTLAV